MKRPTLDPGVIENFLSRLCAGISLREFGGGLSTWDGSPASCLKIRNYWTFPYQTR
jgi:hypothetical protein